MNTGCFNLNRGGEYAIAALTRLALESGGVPGRPIPVRVLAEVQAIPKSFLSKILELCTRSGLITSKSGANGGVALAKPASEISLLDILEACEGPYHRADCVFYGERKCEGTDCVVFCPLREREEDVRISLARTTLAEMAKSLEIHPLNVGPKTEQKSDSPDAPRQSQGGR
ncbi:MAG: Rrf2 family transcriptional regulator [Elusimicrobia bacterium]|nr:Rrf2 family transcriptional regulator [Elusimicrobiota bacterium]